MIVPNEESTGLDVRRRRIHFRVRRRGMHEVDDLLGLFADARLDALTSSELTEFEALLDLPDQQLLSWIIGQDTLPAALTSSLLAAIIAFHDPG